jgi:hypothetical protein
MPALTCLAIPPCQVTYPKFVEAVGACLVLRCASQDDRGRLVREVRSWWPHADTSSTLAAMRDGMMLWRDKVR